MLILYNIFFHIFMNYEHFYSKVHPHIYIFAHFIMFVLISVYYTSVNYIIYKAIIQIDT